MKIQYFLFLAAAFLIFSSSSCKDDEGQGLIGQTTSVTINFTAKYGDEPFILLTDEFEYPDGKMIRFQEEFGLFIAVRRKR
jgi:hypothetical protein